MYSMGVHGETNMEFWLSKSAEFYAYVRITTKGRKRLRDVRRIIITLKRVFKFCYQYTICVLLEKTLRFLFNIFRG